MVEGTTVAAAPEPAATDATAVSEPAGWGTAPEAAAAGAALGSRRRPATAAPRGARTTSSGSGWGTGAAATTAAAATPTQPAQPATPSVPAGWYHDPAGRYELRYWDGSAWTEHVSRNGQQYTDPPVA